MTAPAGPASKLLAAECESLSLREDMRGESFLAEVAAQCRQPLRVMVSGDVSAGKSTLVNALLGRELAEVDRPEKTANVTWFRHPSLAAAGTPVPGHRVADVQFPLSERIILVDTPGLNTVSGAHQATLRMLSGREDESGSAAALVYLVVSNLSEQGARRIGDFAGLASADLGNIVLVGGKAEAVPERSAREMVRSEESLEQSAARTEARLRRDAACVRSVAVSQHLAMVARCGNVTKEHVDLVRTIVGDEQLRPYAAGGWHSLTAEWARRKLPEARLEPLKALVPNITWLVAEIPPDVDLDVKGLAACFERVSRLPRLEQVLLELADDADLLTASAATGRLRRWAGRRGSSRAGVVREQLDRLWRHSAFTAFPQRRAALLLGTSIMDHIPAADRDLAVALLRGRPAVSREESWAEISRRWHLRANSAVHGVIAAEVAQVVATAAVRRMAAPEERS